MIGFMIFMFIGFFALGFFFGGDWQYRKTKDTVNALLDTLENCKPEGITDFEKQYNKTIDAVESLIMSHFM